MRWARGGTGIRVRLRSVSRKAWEFESPRAHNRYCMKYKPGYFKGKKITIMGLGLLGRGVGDAKFFAEKGADLIVTDLKKPEELKDSLDILKKFKNIKFVLGGHRIEDFRKRDFILKAAGVPLDSSFVSEARINKIPVEMDASLFAKLADGVKIVGVTGTRGKTTTTTLIYEILKRANGKTGKKVFLGGNIRGTATLPLIKEAKTGDIVVLELDSWQLQGFGEAKISPHIAVFTNLMDDHLNYYKGDKNLYLEDKAQIFLNQKQEDFLIVGPGAVEAVEKYSKRIKSKIVFADPEIIKSWNVRLIGKHNMENIAMALDAARSLGVADAVSKKVIEEFQGVSGRMEMIRDYKGIKIFNDTTATTPDATLAALRALGGERNAGKIVLIMGGTDKNLDTSELMKSLNKYCKAVVFLAGTGTDKLNVADKRSKIVKAESLKEAVEKALGFSKKGDIILFSPAFASFGMFKNEYDRGDQFNEIIKNLK